MLIVNIDHGLTGRIGSEARFSGSLRVLDGRIVAMGDLSPEPGEEVVDARGSVVVPGFVNTHHHLFQSILKGLPEAIDLPLEPWLMTVPLRWWPMIDEDALRVAARIGLSELALSGATTVCDHHYLYSDRLEYDPALILFEEAARFGLRFVLARGGGTRARAFDDPTMPPPPVETLDGFLSGVEATAARWHQPGEMAMRRVAVAPSTPTFNVEPDALPEIAQVARAAGLRLHSHLSENTGYAAFTEARFGMRPVEWLAGRGWLGPDVWYAHLVDCTDREVAMLAETGTAMAHCPQANARLGSGVAPADRLHEQGGTVSLAVDGAAANEAADMGQALQAAFLVHRAAKGVGAVQAGTVLHWATEGGARALGMEWTGTLAPGKAADLALLDLDSPRALGMHEPCLAPVICGGLPVRHSFVAGRPVVRDGRLANVSTDGLAAEAARTLHRIRAGRHAASEAFV